MTNKLAYSRKSAWKIGWRSFKQVCLSIVKLDWNGFVYNMRKVKVCVRVFFTGDAA